MTVPYISNSETLDDVSLRQKFPRHWMAMRSGLSLISATGCCIVQELAEALADQFGWPGNSFAARYIFRQRLPTSGLVHYETLPYFHSGLGVVRLSESGKMFCRLRNWPLVQSEWERLNELHEGEKAPQHTALVLAFAREARCRGCQTKILPEVDGLAGRMLPDILIENSHKRVYVEVERSRVLKTDKWDNLDKLQGFVAVCVQSRARRKRLVARLHALNLPGLATDLETLSQRRASGDPGPLWLEDW